MPRPKPSRPDETDSVTTVSLLREQYAGRAVLPVDIVVRDYFPHITVESFVHKVTHGQIALPLIRMDDSQKAMKGVHLLDLAIYLDRRKSMANREVEAFHSNIG